MTTGARPRISRTRVFALFLVGTALVSAGSDAQQRFRRGGRFSTAVRMATAESFDGAFNFCRIVFRNGQNGDGGGWAVDYPRADQNLSIRLSELTKTRISRDAAGEPNHVVVSLTDPALFLCPFVMLTEPGGAYLDDDEAARLRDYLLKGGFLWADDFWGTYAWNVWAGEIRKVLPQSEYAIVDLSTEHPIFRTLFPLNRFPQIPSINFWMGNDHTSERGADSAEPHVRAITDKRGRLMVLITHNTDFGDAFEREGDNREYFYRFSVEGYALGIDVLLYAMTH